MKTTISVAAVDHDALVTTVEINTADPNETVRTERHIKVPAGGTKTIELAGDIVDYRLRPAGVATLRQTGAVVGDTSPVAA